LNRRGASDVQIGSSAIAPPYASQLCCNPITHFPSVMPPVRRISFGPVRRLSFGSRSRSSAICVVCIKVFPRTAHQWDSNLDMCRLCAMVQAEEAGHRRARLVAVEEEQRVQQGFTIRIPPRIHRICALCHVDYIVPLVGDASDRCRPCQKSEKCSRCRKIKKKKRFRKENGTDTLYKTCCDCREKVTTRNFQKRLQAESQGAYMHLCCRKNCHLGCVDSYCDLRPALVCERKPPGYCKRLSG